MKKRANSAHSKTANLIYQPNFITAQDKSQIIRYLESLSPLWEMRFSKSNPPPNNEDNRSLLRPVYWLGNWQFACLDYYHPPKWLRYRCVEAESYPPVLQKIVNQIEQMVHEKFSEKDIPHGWHLNTCLINFYGDKIIESKDSEKSQDETRLVQNQGSVKKIDVARVGEHKDFEPGPVGSISFGEKALFQFVKSQSKEMKSEIVLQQWLEDSSLQIFGGDKFKKQLFHRVQRVESKGFLFKNMKTTHFETRRINFTFRYVPNEHITPYGEFPQHLQDDLKPYVLKLSENSDFWKSLIK